MPDVNVMILVFLALLLFLPFNGVGCGWPVEGEQLRN